MKTISSEQADLIDAVIAEKNVGALTAAILEKDIHVTDALSALLTVPMPDAHFVFCGGTNLSKAHHIIQRMSEDVDLKVVLAPYADQNPSKDRKRLRLVKQEIGSRLAAIGLVEVAGTRKEDSRFFHADYAYEPRYQGQAALRPNLKLEYIRITPKLPTAQLEIGYLVDAFAGRAQPRLKAQCSAISETLAEKVMAFLRRFAEAQVQGKWDATQVRHIHDVHCIVEQRAASLAEACTIFPKLLTEEASKFSNKSQSPKETLHDALADLANNASLEADYSTKLLGLLFAAKQPSYQQAIGSFQSAATQLLATL